MEGVGVDRPVGNIEFFGDEALPVGVGGRRYMVDWEKCKACGK